MSCRAAIFVRASSETQGTYSSSIEQAADCGNLACEKGLHVVHIDRDVEKYRMGHKMVEPSASTQIAMPCKKCVKDAKNKFDIILTWHEDRLYRGIRVMLIFLKIVQDYKIAPIRAWTTKMELG